MTAAEMHAQVQAALAITGAPAFPSPVEAGRTERLVYLDEAAGENPPTWGLEPIGYDDAEYAPVATEAAGAMIRDHLRGALAEAGWQVQVHVRDGRPTWRLVDVLSVLDGGGDRIDARYPFGPDELVVLCESVVAIAGDASA